MARLNVIGTGGFAKQVLPLLRQPQFASQAAALKPCFAEDEVSAPKFGEFEIKQRTALPAGELFVVAIGSGSVRRKIAEELEVMGLEPGTLISNTAIIAEDAVLHAGTIVCDFAVIEPCARIGRHFHANCFSFVAHECVIGDYVTLGPRATCNGNVHIGDGAYIGAGALIRQGNPSEPLRIGEGATVGMGAVVTKDVPANSTVAGNPARIIS